MVKQATIHAGPALDPHVMTDVRRRAIFECCKWDPQVGDVSTLAEFPLVIDRGTWDFLARSAEQLDTEALAAEAAIVASGTSLSRLGLPRQVNRAIRSVGKSPSPALRTSRYDFHLAQEGWRISEVNSDVPGGYIEASGFAALMSEATGLAMVGDPARALADAIAERAASRVALVHATGYSDDRQVMVFLSKILKDLSIDVSLVAPDQLRWGVDGAARLPDGATVDLIFRFFPGEWLPNLPGREWCRYFGGGSTILSSPATAMVTQTKRFPLAWDELELEMKMWRALLPEVRDPREAPWREDESWIIKPAMGRVGDSVIIPGVTDCKVRRRAALFARLWPRAWAAQRRFHAVGFDAPTGVVYPCIGVYVINGKAAGAYGRIAERPLIDDRARDVAVLLAPPGADDVAASPFFRGGVHERARVL